MDFLNKEEKFIVHPFDDNVSFNPIIEYTLEKYKIKNSKLGTYKKIKKFFMYYFSSKKNFGTKHSKFYPKKYVIKLIMFFQKKNLKKGNFYE